MGSVHLASVVLRMWIVEREAKQEEDPDRERWHRGLVMMQIDGGMIYATTVPVSCRSTLECRPTVNRWNVKHIPQILQLPLDLLIRYRHDSSSFARSVAEGSRRETEVGRVSPQTGSCDGAVIVCLSPASV